ncbi:FAD-dependent oxidoreductase [Microlunatus antarcticus]|uniref:Isorenieratene synthase n=1 Tax=Microlunatus antarcticus TaxID=53388 RepID=A0A7W5P6X8_9ACTN|nr:isorenieratene synthase [Microlunatus antarcticus]
MRVRHAVRTMKQAWLPGRDKKAVRHPGEHGALRPSPDQPQRSTLVLGGGIAGIAAAVGLAERGVEVTLVEREAQLGGRVRSWPVEHDSAAGAPVTMSRGFHAFFRQYYNLRALLRRVDPALEGLTAVEDYPLVLAGGHRDSFAGVPRTPPLNMAAFVAQSPSFTAGDLKNIDEVAVWELLDVDFPATFSAHDGESAAAFLDRLGFPDAARHLALEVFARSFFAAPDEFSAGELVGMFHSYFLGSSEGLLFDVPVDDYDTIFWGPLRGYLERLGVEVRAGETVQDLDLGGDQVSVTTDRGTLTADTVVLATDLRTTRSLVETTRGSLDDPGWRSRIAETRDAPPFAVWRLWLDRKVAADRPAFLGTSGYGPMDNITVLERFEAGARRWSDAHDASVVEVHAYALQPEDGDEAQVRRTLRAELARVYPETADAEVVGEEWLLSDDCPLVGTTPWVLRPEVATPDLRLVLAGDGIRCDYPVALMERAATTGFLAANRLLAGWGLAGHDLWTVPMSTRQPGLLKARTLLDRVSA